MIHSPYVKHILATDISPNMIEIGRIKASAEGIENITFEVATCDEVSEPDGSLDAVLAMNVLHLLEDKEAVIEKVYRMLKPGGVFVSSTSCLTGMMKLLKLILPIGALFGKMPRTLRCFSSKS